MPKPSVETSLLQCLVSQHFTFTLQIRNMYFSRQKSQSLILRHLGKAVFEQNQDFSEESNLCNTSIKKGIVSF